MSDEVTTAAKGGADLGGRGGVQGPRLSEAEAVASAEALAELVGWATHELNNLLSTVISFSELLSQELTDPEQRLDAEAIHTAGKHAARVSSQLRVAAQRADQALPVVRLEQVVEPVRALVAELLGDGARMSVHVDAELGQVRADAVALQHSLASLVRYARGDARGAGTASLALTNVELSVDAAQAQRLAPGRYVALEVVHAVEGEAARERVYTAYTSWHRDERLVGPWLPIVAGLVRRWGGGLTVSAPPSVSPAFRVLLPVIGAVVEAAPREAPASAVVGGGQRVLVVEDDEGVRTLVQRMLTRAGFEVITASGGVEGIALHGRHADEIDLVLTDVVMPDLSGPKLADAVRLRSPRVPVLFMSGHGEAVLRREGLRSEFPVLEKPFNAEQLLAAVTEVLGAGRGR